MNIPEPTWKTVAWAVTVAFLVGVVGLYTLAFAVGWNNDSMLTVEHPMPIDFVFEDNGFSAQLEDGSNMTCLEIYSEPRIVRCDWQEAYWWVYGDGVVYGLNSHGASPSAGSDLQALSVILSLQ